MRKLLLICLCLFLLASTVFAESNEITNFDTRIQVDENGIRHVTATVEIRFTNHTTFFDFPLGKEAEEIIASGGAYELKTIDGVKCVRFLNEAGFVGTQSFRCSYILPCNMTESSDAQHFRTKIPERGWEYAIANYALTVDFPKEITRFPLWESSYYGDDIENYLHIQIREGQVTAVSNTAFRDHETVTMRLDFEPDSFTLRHLAEQTVSTDRLVFFLLFALCITYWLLYLRGRLRYGKSDSSIRFRSSAGEIPCQLYGGLPDMAGLIAHWGNLGYITLRRTRGGVFRLEKQMEMGNECSSAERRIFHSIFRTLSFVDLSGTHFCSAVAAEAPVLRAHWKNRMFHRGRGRPGVLRTLAMLAGLCVSLMIFDTMLPAAASRWFWLVFLSLLTLPLYRFVQAAVRYVNRFGHGIYALLGIGSIVILFLLASRVEMGVYMFFGLLLQCFCAYVTRFGGKRSLSGEEAVEELTGFRRKIAHSTAESARILLSRDKQYFYRALPYAEILGVGRVFVKHFAPPCTDSCPWFIDERTGELSAMDFYRLYKALLKQLRFSNPLQALERRFHKSAATPRVRPGSNGKVSSSADRRPSSDRQKSSPRKPTASDPRRPSHSQRNGSRRPVGSAARKASTSGASRRP